MKKYFIILSLAVLIAWPVRAQEITVTSSSEIYNFTTSSVTAIEVENEIVSSTDEIATSTENIYEVKTDRETITEPTIRVGLLKSPTQIRFRSEMEYEIYSGEEMLGTLLADEEAKISYKNGNYFLVSENNDLVGKDFLRLVPSEADGVFELPGCKRAIPGRKGVYCEYRGIFEYRYGQKSKMPYLINELPLEDYMKGIAETDNNSAKGYIKAVLVAARSYAYKNISFSPPTNKRLFDVFATTQDQLYLGYASEIKMPRVAKFAQETAGEMVTFESNVVTTPYFTHTNGKTKDWKNLAGKKERPWLVSVECIYDKYKKYYGHGIGMSTHDALMRATKDNWVYIQLLKHYYSGTEIEKIY